jgi:hypothetical protein
MQIWSVIIDQNGILNNSEFQWQHDDLKIVFPKSFSWDWLSSCTGFLGCQQVFKFSLQNIHLFTNSVLFSFECLGLVNLSAEGTQLTYKTYLSHYK